MNKKRWIIILIIVIIIALILFFYPKKCGYWSTGYINKECPCFGIKTTFILPFVARAGGGDYYCYGFCNKDGCECNYFLNKTIIECP